MRITLFMLFVLFSFSMFNCSSTDVNENIKEMERANEQLDSLIRKHRNEELQEKAKEHEKEIDKRNKERKWI